MDFGTALGYGVGAAAGGLATSKYAEIESQITQDRAAALAQIKSNIDISQQETLRQNKVSQINAAADQSAQQRAGAVRQGLINSDMAPGNTEPVSADPNDLIAADHGDTSQLKNSDLSTNAQNTLNAASQPNDSDIVRGSVKAGYTDPLELVKMRQQDRSLAYQQATIALKEKHEDSVEQRNEAYAKHQDDWMKVMTARLTDKGPDADTALIRTAKAIQADEKSRGSNVSLSQAIDMTHKAADNGNTFAMNYARIAGDNRQIGDGKKFKTIDDAISAGRKAFVAQRAQPGGENQDDSDTTDTPDSQPSTRPPLSSFAQ